MSFVGFQSFEGVWRVLSVFVLVRFTSCSFESFLNIWVMCHRSGIVLKFAGLISLNLLSPGVFMSGRGSNGSGSMKGLLKANDNLEHCTLVGIPCMMVHRQHTLNLVMPIPPTLLLLFFDKQ